LTLIERAARINVTSHGAARDAASVHFHPRITRTEIVATVAADVRNELSVLGLLSRRAHITLGPVYDEGGASPVGQHGQVIGCSWR